MLAIMPALLLSGWWGASELARERATSTVSSLADSGPGTLRQALLDAGSG